MGASSFRSLIYRSGREGSRTLSPDRAILERRTSRLAPGPEPMTGEQIKALRAEAAAFGHECRVVSDAPLVRRILDRNIEAVMHDLADARYGSEIRRWYRYTEGARGSGRATGWRRGA